MNRKPSCLKPHPHTAQLRQFESGGNYFHKIAVEIAVPSRIAAMLHENGCGHIIPSAGIGDISIVKARARVWKSGLTIAGKKRDGLRACLENIDGEDCDTPIMIAISIHEWHLVGMLCGKLGITPGQWYLAGAAYSAAIEEESIDRQLAAITNNPADLSA